MGGFSHTASWAGPPSSPWCGTSGPGPREGGRCTGNLRSTSLLLVVLVGIVVCVVVVVGIVIVIVDVVAAVIVDVVVVAAAVIVIVIAVVAVH